MFEAGGIIRIDDTLCFTLAEATGREGKRRSGRRGKQPSWSNVIIKVYLKEKIKKNKKNKK